MSMLKVGLAESDSIDLTIGRKGFNYELPYDVRKNAIEIALEVAGMRDRINILGNKVFDIDPSDYNALLLGSDILCKLTGQNRFRSHEISFFQRFPLIVCVERDQHLVTREVRQRAEELSNLKVIRAPNGTITGTEIREILKRGGDIRSRIPPGVWDAILPHAESLKNS